MPVRPLLRSGCLLALALASGSAAALGLGQIRVLSAPGEPLVAEIPVVSSDPEELRNLRAGLASPETFTRIGLEPPIGVVADLRFATSADPSGRPVIRVTSSQPVTEPMLTFLVEVDWGQGRLVREYSALVAAPQSVAAQPPAPVQVPQVQAPAVVERAPVAAPQQALPQQAVAPQQGAARPPSQTPVPSRPAPVAVAPAPAGGATDGDYRVRAGDTLSRIAGRVSPEGASVEQTMVGLLRANPQAFIGGDMNQLRQGSVLRLPAASELEAIEAREAAQLVRSYARQWREARSQPQAQGRAQQSAAPAEPPGTRAPTGPATAARSDGRLEIVPPGASRATQAGTQSGIAAGGEGDIVQQELQQTRETLAARDAELQELRSRVAELEKLQADQQKLIALKDAELNAAGQRVEQAGARDDAGASPLVWLGGGALVLLGLLAAAWNRRRATRNPVFRAPSAGAPGRPSVADAFAPASPPPGAGPSAAGAAVAVSSAQVASATAPSWERQGAGTRRASSSAPARTTAGAPASAAAAARLPAAPAAPEPAIAQVPPADAERLELAQAYLDLGDTAKARQLLDEVADGHDATASAVARRMLQGLG